MFDWMMVDEVLFRLDFRKKVVKYLGTREHWHGLVMKDWKKFFNFSEFYKGVMKSVPIPWKPTYIGEPIVDFKVIFDSD